jgi:ribosomal protein S18 acetylase RimI-like enzyme
VRCVEVVDGLASRWLASARTIAFEYLALTQGEAGLPVPQDISALPVPLQAVLDSLSERHAPPGALLLALSGDTVCATVALQHSWLTVDTDAVVQRLYVREAFRRRGIARELMAAVHAIAVREGFHRLVLNVMTSRTAALAFYESLGYAPLTEPIDWPYGGIWLGRDVNS